MFISILKVR